MDILNGCYVLNCVRETKQAFSFDFFFFYKAKIQGIDSLVLGTVLGFCLGEFPQCRSLFILPVSHTSAGFALCLILIPNL